MGTFWFLANIQSSPECARGRFTALASDTYSTASPPYAVKVKVTDADEASVWVEGGAARMGRRGQPGAPAPGKVPAREQSPAKGETAEL